MQMKAFKKLLATTMAVLLAINVGPIGLAQAKMVTTEQIIEQTAPASDRDKIVNFIQREDVQEQFVLLGVDPKEAASRVASLSDAEVQQIAGQLDELPAGEGAVGAIVGAIVLIFLVLLITDLLGLTDVFPFVKKTAR